MIKRASELQGRFCSVVRLRKCHTTPRTACCAFAFQAKHSAHLVYFVTNGLTAAAAPDACHHDNPSDAKNTRGLDDISVPRVVYSLSFITIGDSSKGGDCSVASVQNRLDTLEVQRVTNNRRYACDGGSEEDIVHVNGSQVAESALSHSTYERRGLHSVKIFVWPGGDKFPFGVEGQFPMMLSQRFVMLLVQLYPIISRQSQTGLIDHRVAQV